MGTNTKISWCDHTWNSWLGCTPVSVGCDNCYARAMRKRYGHNPTIVQRTSVATWRQPLVKERNGQYKWKSGERVFVCSMSDFWHPAADKWRSDAWSIMSLRPDLEWLVLTKRPERALARIPYPQQHHWVNIWLGVTAEDHEHFMMRVPEILQAPCLTFWVSHEPLLDKINVEQLASTLDWAVIGAESGSQRRPCKLEWVRELVEQYKAVDTPIFIKQLDLDGRLSKDPSEWPEDLRLQQFPEVSDGILFTFRRPDDDK